MTDKKEIYKEIVGHPGYFVSNLGKVKKISKNDPTSEKEMSIDPSKFTVRFTKDGASKSYKVSTLVADAFLEPADGRRKIRHKDGNPANNQAKNLSYLGLTREQVRNIKKGLLKHESMGELARKYGIERTFVRKIRDGLAWKEIEIEVEVK